MSTRAGSPFVVRLVMVLLVAIAPAGSQVPSTVPESPAILALRRAVASGDTSAGSRFWSEAAARKTPLVDSLPNDARHVLATFVYRGGNDVTDVVLVAGPNGIAPFTDPRSHMQHLAGTDVWFVSNRLARDAEFFYQISVNPPAIRGAPQAALLRPTFAEDPFNPLQYPEAGDPMAAAGHGFVARMPGVTPNPWIAQRPGIPAGTLAPDSLSSRALGGARKVWAYASPGASLSEANVLIVFDGAIYVNRIPTPTILDNLYAERRVGPTIAVFVDNGGLARAKDYYFSDAYNEFLANELLPWIQQKFGVRLSPKRTVVAGSSLGGLAAAFAALRRPDLFGKVLSQSGAFWPNGRDATDEEPEWLPRQFARASTSDVYFYLTVGSYESTPALETTLLASNRHLRDILALKGYRADYVELPGDHEPVSWRRALPQGLIATLNPSQ